VIAEAAQGSYTITATTGRGERTSHSFDIKEYGSAATNYIRNLPKIKCLNICMYDFSLFCFQFCQSLK